MSQHVYQRSLPAFRPSVYVTGMQGVQPYNAGWPQGAGYGYIPSTMATDYGYNPFTVAADWWADKLTSAASTLATAYDKVQADRVAAEAERQRLLEEQRRASFYKAAGIAALGVVSFVAYRRYRTTGRVFGAAPAVPAYSQSTRFRDWEK